MRAIEAKIVVLGTQGKKNVWVIHKFFNFWYFIFVGLY